MAEKIGLFYGSSTGAGEKAATIIKRELDRLGIADVDLAVISGSNLKTIENYQYLIFGCSTWNIGELQDDWDLNYDALNAINFAGRKVALFGNGDQYGYSNSFVDAIGIIGDKVNTLGGEIVGLWPKDGYEFEFSRAIFEDVFLGLPLDDDNEPDKTPQRVISWLYYVLEEFGLDVPEEVYA